MTDHSTKLVKMPSLVQICDYWSIGGFMSERV
jgi:hypothetical protein